MKFSESKREQNRYESLFFQGEMDSETPSCDLHGLTSDRAISECDSFINHEFMNGTEVVRIVHGRGTGKLRDKIHKFLKSHELVEDFRDSQNPNLILGMTIVILSKRH
jgi:DNA mismatch repair protein MutS2